ncbi:MAG: 4-(cytidine 5'-diphospho)-2-C-methyl-D-erythritol kinase [Spirochaetes bacterium]|nr:4-(cytidine 5'-diphospho)-2-C-methyl-D-erythritol kinase [Spirochaetota bacterium]MBU1079410.1 4-(cytidine 5'-diphospho)-2-C-methyl-D-erythritol kinase [Spirochaetota bacterium]
MNPDIVVPAPAKINLHLAVGGRRADGFHPIASVFQAVSLEDVISIRLSEGRGVSVAGDCGCPENRNTAYRAAIGFAEAAESSGSPLPRINVSVEKRIPIGAGLGGGSSDAASTLRGLACLFPGAVDRESLSRIAALVGSDVPFFMGTACAAVTGRGERLSPVAPRTDYAIVIADPGFPVSTKEAYGLLDRSRESVPAMAQPSDDAMGAELASAVAAYGAMDPSRWPFRNDFFDALRPSFPGLAECRDALVSAGAAFAALSGSGSAVFGVFASAGEAVRAASALSPRYSAHIAFPLARLTDSI